MKRVVLIDGHSILFRAYFALPKTFRDREGNPTNAVYGFFSMLLKIVEDLKPDFLAIAFDEKGPTFRHQELVTYKEGRPEMDEELAEQQPVVRKLLESFGIPVYSREGFEGEDVIATVVAKLRIQNSKLKTNKEEMEFYVVSGDRDVLQLVDKNTKVYSPKKGLSQPVIYDEKNVAEVFGIKASQIPDFKGLRGDASDRLPGVFGVGEKTARELIQRFGSIEDLYRNLGQVRPLFGETVEKKLIEGAEQAVLSKKLAEVRADVPLSLNLPGLKFSGLKSEEGLNFLRSLGFRSLLKRLGYAEGREKKIKVEGKRKTKENDQKSLALPGLTNL